MTAKEMIELVKQHHPHMGEVEVLKLLNRAKDDYCAQTEIVKKRYTHVSADANTETAANTDGDNGITATVANRVYIKNTDCLAK